jgi:TetR/AcrR family transcriptional regulator
MTSAKSHKTIGRIMDAATQHFARHGYDGARMDLIAEEAGVNKATIYYHLGGKKQLYTAVLHAVYSDYAKLMAGQVDAAPEPEEKLKVIFRALRKLVYDYPHINAIMMYELASGGRNFPDILTEDFTQIIGLTADTLKMSHESGHTTAIHPMVLYLMAIGPLSYYEKISSGLKGPLMTGSQARDIPVLSFHEFARQLETILLNTLKTDCDT